MYYKQKIGKYGEELAVWYLKSKGFIILDRNFETRRQELDIIAKEKNKTVFVEVKTRTNSAFGGADNAMSQKKLDNLKRALSKYVNIKKLDPNNVRLDLIAIDINNKHNKANIKHYKDIF